MRLLARLVVSIIANGLGLYLASRYITGFILDASDLKSFLIVAAILTLLNWFAKPALKLILGPIIVLTLGLGLIIVNMLVLAALDFLSGDLTIVTIHALLYASLLIGALNFVFHLAQKD